MTAVCALSLFLAVWIGQAALRAPEPHVAAVGGVFAGAVAVASVWVWCHCRTNPHPLATVRKEPR